MIRRTCLVALIAALAALAVGLGPFTGTSSAAEMSGAVIGVWERPLRNDAGPDPVIVMELKSDGTYSISGMPFVEDRGSFSLQIPGVLAFTSNVNPGKNRLLAVKLDGENTLTLFTNTPFSYSEVWIRKQSAPNFPSVAMNGADIPEGLPVLIASALDVVALPWREDAAPTWIRVERMKNGRYRITLHFFSPSAAEEMQINVTEYGINKSVHDGSRAVSAPLPPNFMDLPRIVEAAGAQGFKGALKKADVRAYKGYGPAWMTVFAGARNGATFSATTGKRINADVTGYIAQYEADWNHAGEVWRKALEQYRKEDNDTSGCDDAVWGASGCGYKFAVGGWKRNCSVSGGTWRGGGCY